MLTAAATVGLIGLGGIVTSKGAGLAVPDWPNTYGYNMFFFPFSDWIGGVFWEHSHRLAGAGVGLLTVLLSIWTFGKAGRKFLRYVLAPVLVLGGVLCFVPAEPRMQDGMLLVSLGALSLVGGFFWPSCQASPRWIRLLGGIAVVGVLGQGILGGLRVRLLQDDLGIFHAVAAHLILVLMTSIALLTSRWWTEQGEGAVSGIWTRAMGWMSAAMVVMIFGQLVLGAVMRHQHAGLPVQSDDFPLAGGRLLPSADKAAVDAANAARNRTADYRDFNPITRGHILLYRAHLILALVIFASALLLLFFGLRVVSGHWLGNVLIVWFALICVQGLLGAATVWSNKAADIATLHVVFGALALALASLSSMISFRLAQAARRGALEAAGSLSGLAGDSGGPSGVVHSGF